MKALKLAEASLFLKDIKLKFVFDMSFALFLELKYLWFNYKIIISFIYILTFLKNNINIILIDSAFILANALLY